MKRFPLMFVSVCAASALLASCVYLPDPVDAKHEYRMSWSDGKQVKVERTIELSADLLEQAPDGATTLEGFEARTFDPSIQHLRDDFNLEFEYRDTQTVTQDQGYIANARIVQNGTAIDLYDGSGTVDNIVVVLAEDHIVWAELSDSDSAATWDWSIKSVSKTGGAPIQLARMEEFPQLKDAEASLQEFNMGVLGTHVLWSPSVDAPESTQSHLVVSAPIDGSEPARVIAERTRLVPSTGVVAAAQKQEPLVVNAPSGLQDRDIVDVGASATATIFEVGNNAELLANVGSVLAFKSRESIFLADTEAKLFTRVTLHGSAPTNVSVCGTSFVFDSVDEEHNQTTFVIDANDYSVSGEFSSTGVRCVIPDVP